MAYTFFVRIIQTGFCQGVSCFLRKIFGNFLPLQEDRNKQSLTSYYMISTSYGNEKLGIFAINANFCKSVRTLTTY